MKLLCQISKSGIINIHGSLLPRWRGAAPIAHAIYNRDKVTGITIMKIKPKHFDIGEILMKREIPIPEHVTALELGHIMAPIGADMVIETLSDLVNLENKAVEQPSEGATRAPKIKESMGCVDFENQGCDDVYRQYRAFCDKVSMIAAFGELEVKFLDMKLCDLDTDFYSLIQTHFGISDKDLPAGSIFCYKLKKLLMVKCKDGWVGFGKIIVRSKSGWTELRPADFNVYLKNDKHKIFTVHQLSKLK
ncbi:hypothetical protein KUTeg_011084 [Tegillarca granosa]|uniref:Methionyl-tRNA formyltransferase n=1 Tax=Tegillarca granosa TaxID=220873 RepID=A0ABQ9F322_TEGGR|nr:hypothetical protein KUTeg_011084 [Tegillarca granosa]